MMLASWTEQKGDDQGNQEERQKNEEEEKPDKQPNTERGRGERNNHTWLEAHDLFEEKMGGFAKLCIQERHQQICCWKMLSNQCLKDRFSSLISTTLVSDRKKLNQEHEIHWEELPTLIFRPTISQKKLYKVAMASFCCPKKCTVSLLQMCSTHASHS